MIMHMVMPARDAKGDTLHPERNCQAMEILLPVPVLLMSEQLLSLPLQSESEAKTLTDPIPSLDILLRLRMTSSRRPRAP